MGRAFRSESKVPWRTGKGLGLVLGELSLCAATEKLPPLIVGPGGTTKFQGRPEFLAAIPGCGGQCGPAGSDGHAKGHMRPGTEDLDVRWHTFFQSVVPDEQLPIGSTVQEDLTTSWSARLVPPVLTDKPAVKDEV